MDTKKSVVFVDDGRELQIRVVSRTIDEAMSTRRKFILNQKKLKRIKHEEQALNENKQAKRNQTNLLSRKRCWEEHLKLLVSLLLIIVFLEMVFLYGSVKVDLRSFTIKIVENKGDACLWSDYSITQRYNNLITAREKQQRSNNVVYALPAQMTFLARAFVNVFNLFLIFQLTKSTLKSKKELESANNELAVNIPQKK